MRLQFRSTVPLYGYMAQVLNTVSYILISSPKGFRFLPFLSAFAVGGPGFEFLCSLLVGGVLFRVSGWPIAIIIKRGSGKDPMPTSRSRCGAVHLCGSVVLCLALAVVVHQNCLMGHARLMGILPCASGWWCTAAICDAVQL